MFKILISTNPYRSNSIYTFNKLTYPVIPMCEIIVMKCKISMLFIPFLKNKPI
jgi:hypothetical protein